MRIMDVGKNRLHKPNSPNRRLRLKKNYMESIDNKTYLSNDSNNENKKNDTACTSQSPCDNDSILDFKSPKRKNTMQTKIIQNNRFLDKSKKKVLCSKSKIINNGRQFEGNKLLNKKVQHDVQQPSIESSFFKSEKNEIDSPQSLTNVKTAYVCPLCFKNFKDESLQTIHMKSCAIKNNVTTKTLMNAMELQERQAAERKSLGLLSAPILQDKKKPVSRKMTSHDDPDLQLALALSKSLYEKEEMEEWDEAQIVAISSSLSLPDSNAEYSQKATLQSFGFTSSKNISPTKSWPINKIKKRKLIEPTILQRRTAAEKERILTERIAEILMAYKDFTQRSQGEQANNIKEKIVLKNQLLQRLHQTENTLWDRTRLTPTQKVFYVKQLSPYITPLEKKEQKLNEEQNVKKFMEQNIDNKITLNDKQILETKEMKTKVDNNEELISSNAIKTCCKEKTFLNILATSWRNMLNDSSASDIIIFVKNARHIWVHKLVFHARCSNILLDVISNDTEFSTAKEKICWIDTDYDAASAFLEFVYCGVINEHIKIFNSETSLSDIRFLARKYKVNDLFVYLRQKEFKSNITGTKHEICGKNTENVYADMIKILNISNTGKSSFNASPNHLCDLENIQRMLSQKNVNDNLHPLEDNYISVKNSCLLQDEKPTLIRTSEDINSRSNTPANLEISNPSPDMFDDTSDTMICNSMAHSNDHEDSNIHILFSLIKQDKDVNICSQTSLTEKQSAEYSQLGKDIPINLDNMEENVMEIHSDFESDSQKLFISNKCENSLIDTPQSSKPKSIQDSSLKLTKQKSNLTLFIEEMERQNAKLDSDLASDIEYSVEISPIKHKNPFHIDRCNNSEDSQSYNDNIEQSSDAEKKPSRLSIIEQRMRSYADKNPEFYTRLSKNDVDIKQINTLHMVPIFKMSMESSCNNTQSFTSIGKDVNILEQIAPLSAICSPHIETATQSLNETVFDVETDEEEVSMYSRYMKDHKENSIANYRAAIRKTRLNDSLSNKSTSSDSISKNSDTTNDTESDVLAKSVLTQKDANIIVSDTKVENISSSVSHLVVSNKDDSDHEDIMPCSTQQSKRTTEYDKQDIKNQKNNQLVRVGHIPKALITDLEEEKDFNSSTKSNREEFNASNTNMVSNDIDCNMIFMQKKFRCNESSDDQKEKSISSPIMVPSSPEFSDVENLLLNENCGELISETNIRESRKSSKLSINFEDEIYLANVDIDMYGKHVLEKSQSTSILNMTGLKKHSAHRCDNKNNDENIRVNNSMANNDVIPVCEKLDNNTMFLTQNFASIRKFKRKSLSEGQININRYHNREASTHASVQFKCNFNKNIENTKTVLKIIEKDVTPPPDYIGMKTPELHKEMKKYGLKVQKRGRAVKLLTHIYNELHPLVSIAEITSIQEVTEISSDEDEGPPSKKRNVDNNSLKILCDVENNDDKLLCSQNSDSDISSGKDPIGKEMELSETESLLENPSNILEAFTGLLDVDKDLHNKILQYEPVNIKELHHTLRIHGFKCKLSNLMNFLDEQCITFYMPEQSTRTRKRKNSSI
ncbi:uncharacterized protein MAL8P1.12 isoform X2 [Polyergus mexicanus]|uniref:uncharacterized protein MAL8P1.12 isoform X2 n=1 Tax=Polyergus mexicanus TaxID=615972 RepID=UPI0038B4B395